MVAWLKGIGLREQTAAKVKVSEAVSEAHISSPDSHLTGFKTYFISINAIGSLMAMESFFKSIEKSSRLIFLESLHSSVSSEEMPSFSLVLKTYSR